MSFRANRLERSVDNYLARPALVTGAARGIGRATAVAFAREGADVMGIDIAGPVSATLEVVPATPVELADTGRLLEAAGARWTDIEEKVLEKLATSDKATIVSEPQTDGKMRITSGS